MMLGKGAIKTKPLPCYYGVRPSYGVCPYYVVSPCYGVSLCDASMVLGSINNTSLCLT